MEPGFALDSDWYWRIFEGTATVDDPAIAARDFVRPLARLARDRFVIDDIGIAGDDVTFRLADQPVGIACRGVPVARFVAAINDRLAAARLDVRFAIVVPRRYEVRGILVLHGHEPAR